MSEEQKIEEMLNIPKNLQEKDLKKYIQDVNNKIHKYELGTYSEGYDEKKAKTISNWRFKFQRAVKIAKMKLKTSKETMVKEINPQHCDLLETVKMVAKQVTKAEENLEKIGKSSIKLKSLNTTTEELYREIKNTKRKIDRKKEKEERENFLIQIGFLIFLIVCSYILVDRLGILKFFLFKRKIIKEKIDL